MGSDHEVFEAAGFRVPMAYFHDYPDVTIHTQKDQPENLDATKLGRVAYLGAGVVYTLAALPDAEAPRVLAEVRRRRRERASPAREPRRGPDAPLRVREASRVGRAGARERRRALAVGRRARRRRGGTARGREAPPAAGIVRPPRAGPQSARSWAR